MLFQTTAAHEELRADPYSGVSLRNRGYYDE